MDASAKRIESVAVIGAGMAGLACAIALADGGLRVTLFEKSRRPGGRLATRRVTAGATLAFNHGAQYVTARGAGFAALIAGLASGGVVAGWPAARHGADVAWVGVPSMSAMTGAMAERAELLGVRLRTDRHVAWLHDDGSVRHLPSADARPGSTQPEGGECCGPFDAVLLAVPAPQAAALLATRPVDSVRSCIAAMERVAMAPCWTVMAAFAERIESADILRSMEGPLAWAARENSRPGQAEAPDRWTLQAGAAWSSEHLEDDPETVKSVLLRAFVARTGCSALPVSVSSHRWRHAMVSQPLGDAYLWDAESRIGLCGDWCLGARVEAAFDSGTALAGAVLAA